MFASRQRAPFGKREAITPVEPAVDDAALSAPATAERPYCVLPQPPALPAGVVISPEPVEWIPHADVLRRLGPHPDQAFQPLPGAIDHDRMVCASYVAQEARRTGLEDELLRLHGHNAIRPFFVLGEGVYNSAVGRWLVEALRLMPYDAWNTTYLPLDAPTAGAMRLPYHPRRSIQPVDTLIHHRLNEQRERYEVAVEESVAALRGQWDEARLDRFLAWREALRAEILAYAAQIRPMVVGLIAEAQDKGTRL